MNHLKAGAHEVDRDGRAPNLPCFKTDDLRQVVDQYGFVIAIEFNGNHRGVRCGVAQCRQAQFVTVRE